MVQSPVDETAHIRARIEDEPPVADDLRDAYFAVLDLKGVLGDNGSEGASSDIKNRLLEISNRLRSLAKEKKRRLESRYLSFIDIKRCRASLNKASSDMKKAAKALDSDLAESKDRLAQSLPCIYDLLATHRINRMVRLHLEDDSGFLIEAKDLEKGDLILSYETDIILKKYFYPRIISKLQMDRFAHSRLVVEKAEERVITMHASGFKRAILLAELERHEGEIMFVFRPRLPKGSGEKLFDQIDTWKKKLEVKDYGFAVRRLWFAFLAGLVFWSCAIAFNRLINLGSLFRNDEGYFCSELINEMFKRSGIYLAARSKDSYLIGPFEFKTSCYLEPIGVLKLEVVKN